MDAVFSRIYATGVWGKGSGQGSELAYCQRYVEVLVNSLQECQIRSVLDLGCGDWMHGFSKHINWSQIQYLGLDVVQSVIDANTRQFAAPNIQFRRDNILTADLPPADLILIKDVFQHWSNASVLQFLPKLKQFKFALITNDLITSVKGALNQDTTDGGFRPIDLMAPPFNIPANEIMLYTNATNRPAEPLRWVKKMILIRN